MESLGDCVPLEVTVPDSLCVALMDEVCVTDSEADSVVDWVIDAVCDDEPVNVADRVSDSLAV